VDDAGQYQLSPAYDVLPSLQGLGYQQLRVGTDAADATLDNALSQCAQFGLKRPAAQAEITLVAQVVAGWREHFAAAGMRPRDLEQIAEHVDRPFLRDQREAFARRPGAAPRSGRGACRSRRSAPWRAARR
jgi:serine/threonine-protein kinase HipA